MGNAANDLKTELLSNLETTNSTELLRILDAEIKGIGSKIVKEGVPLPDEGYNGQLVVRRVKIAISKESTALPYSYSLNSERKAAVGLYAKIDDFWYLLAHTFLTRFGPDEEDIESRRGGSKTGRRPGRKTLNPFSDRERVPLYDSDWFMFEINKTYDFKWDFGMDGPSEYRCYFTRTHSNPVKNTNPGKDELGRTRTPSMTERPPGDFIIPVSPYFSSYRDGAATKIEGISFRYDPELRMVSARTGTDRIINFFNKVSGAFEESKPAAVRANVSLADWIRIKVWK